MSMAWPSNVGFQRLNLIAAVLHVGLELEGACDEADGPVLDGLATHISFNFYQ